MLFSKQLDKLNTGHTYMDKTIIDPKLFTYWTIRYQPPSFDKRSAVAYAYKCWRLLKFIDIDHGEACMRVPYQEENCDCETGDCELRQGRGHAFVPKLLSLPPASMEAAERVSPKQRVTFLTLPLEIRLQVYEHLLVSWSSHPWNKDKAGRRIINLKPDQSKEEDQNSKPVPTSLYPALLQTCRQLNQEAQTLLYSRNIFYVHNAARLNEWIAQTGFKNLSSLKHLQVSVPWQDELHKWLDVLDVLLAHATGLRIFLLTFCPKIGAEGYPFSRGDAERGHGESLEFAHRLAKFENLERLILHGGFHGINWPDYFRGVLGKERVAVEKIELSKAWADPKWSKEELDDQIRWIEEQNALFESDVLQFQESTHDMWP